MGLDIEITPSKPPCQEAELRLESVTGPAAVTWSRNRRNTVGNS